MKNENQPLCQFCGIPVQPSAKLLGKTCCCSRNDCQRFVQAVDIAVNAWAHSDDALFLEKFSAKIAALTRSKPVANGGKVLPHGPECALIECQVGLFLFKGTLCMNTEYANEVFVVETGEYFWGGTHSIEKREKLIVQPCRYSTL